MQLKDLCKPKPHYSYSQLSMVESSPSSYYRKYILGETQYETPELGQGADIAKQIEDDRLSNELKVEFFNSNIDRAEEQAEYDISSVIAGHKIKGQIDLYNPNTQVLTEIKTSKQSLRWSTAKAMELVQPKFYAWVLSLKGIHIKKIKVLNLIRRANGTISDSKFWEYEVNNDILAQGKKFFINNIQTIHILTQLHANEKAQTLIQEAMEDYRSTIELIDELTLKKDVLLHKLKTISSKFKNSPLITDTGTGYWTTRKKNIYSDEYEEFKKKQLSERNKLQKKSVVSTTTTSTFSIRLKK